MQAPSVLFLCQHGRVIRLLGELSVWKAVCCALQPSSRVDVMPRPYKPECRVPPGARLPEAALVSPDRQVTWLF